MTNQAFAFVILALAAVANAVKVPVTVYYESLCPDSAKFITEQLAPAVKGELKDYIDINWIPFGKSTFSTQGSEVNFVCHHGVNECYGNKVHACALEHIQANSYQTENTRESLVLDFITCMMRAGKSFDDAPYPGARCAQESKINGWDIISQCANSTESSQLLKRYGEQTLSFENPLSSVPTIVFKDQHDPKVSKRAFSNFRGAACQFITQPQPRICAGENGASSNSFTFGAIFFSVAAFALRNMF